MSRFRRSILVLTSLLIGLAGCRGERAPVEPPTSEGDALADQTDPQELALGAWADYPAPEEEEWDTQPLSVVRWATASAELACAGRAHQGDPDRHREASERILSQYATTADDVMRFGIDLNGDPERAFRLGEVVAQAAESCR